MGTYVIHFPPIGGIVTFTCERDSLSLGAPMPIDSVMDPRALTVAGTVIDVKPAPSYGPGAIPSAYVTIEGRTKKRVTIDGAACSLRVWATWAEALAECQRMNGLNGATAPALPAASRRTG